jgi:CPA1 family monovalent cation:H+ antiporter
LPLSLAPDFPNRDLIIALTLGVALFTILISGTTMQRLIHALKLDRSSIVDRIREGQARVVAKRQGLDQVAFLEKIKPVSREVRESLRQEYQQAVQEAEQSLAALWKVRI